jgi:hypothetical protein
LSALVQVSFRAGAAKPDHSGIGAVRPAHEPGHKADGPKRPERAAEGLRGAQPVAGVLPPEPPREEAAEGQRSVGAPEHQRRGGRQASPMELASRRRAVLNFRWEMAEAATSDI